MKFPDTFPENCPPNDCIKCEGVFYHFVRREIDDPKNFVTHANRGVETSCKAHGLSLYRTLQAAKNLQGMGVFKNRKIARGTLCPDCGKLKNTSRHKSEEHFTLWVYEGIQISTYFEIIGER